MSHRARYSPRSAVLVGLLSIVSCYGLLLPLQASTAQSTASVVPATFSLALTPGQSDTTTLSVFTGDRPIQKGDVLFVFDRTGSMSEEIAQAKASALQIMNAVRAQMPDAWFGVASFMDYAGAYTYPGYAASYGSAAYGDVPWQLNLSPTDNVAAVEKAINDLSIGDGQDWPQDYTRVLYETGRLEAIGWRPNAKKLVVLFGDAPTHDLDFAGYNFGGDPGPDGIAGNADDLNFETVVASLANKGVSVIAVDSGYSPESEATFKGMSIGYGTVAGTGGSYFNLTSASEIPSAVTNMIGSQTQIINHLTLKVPAEYASWVSVTPPEYTAVGPNVTKSFSVTIKVPSTQASGYYPFLIQVLADGTLLGGTYVDVIVPPDSAVSDTGFRPDPDGYGFSNDRASDRSWEMFKQFFGQSQVEYSNGNHVQAADVFFNKRYGHTEGACDGFTSTSTIVYKGLTQRNAGSFAVPSLSSKPYQTKRATVWDAISFAQGVQMGVEAGSYGGAMCQAVQNSPAKFYRLAKSQIETGIPAIIHIIAGQDYYVNILGDKTKVLTKGDGHSILADRFEEPSADTAYLYIYDPNLPGHDEHRVEFDLKNDKWTYRWPIPLWPDIEIGGDATNCLIRAVPVELYRHPGVAYWRVAGYTESAASTSATSRVFSADGPIELLFVDDEGRRLGWDAGTLVQEIPGATYTPSFNQSGTGAGGLFYLPRGVTYTLTVIGVDAGVGEIGVWSDGYMARLASIAVTTSTRGEVHVSDDGSTFTLLNRDGENLVGSLTLNRVLSLDDRTVTIGLSGIGPDGKVVLQLIPGDESGLGGKAIVTTNGSASGTYALSLQWSSGSGYSSFGKSGIVLDGSSTSTILIAGWSNLRQITLEVDRNQDGVADTVETLGSEAHTASMSVEASPTEVGTGGAQSAITVSVLDQFGAPATDGTAVTLATTLGTLVPEQAVTSGGLVHAVLTTGSQAGLATVAAISGSLQATTLVSILSTDVTAPVTTMGVTPAANAEGWNNSSVQVTLTAADDAGGSGVKEISYKLSGAQTGTGVVAGSTTFVAVTAEGTTTITYFAVDNAGNQEAAQTYSVRIDKTPPSVTVPRSLTLQATDASGAMATFDATATDLVDGPLTPTCTPASGSVLPVGNTTVTCSATDRASNTGSASFVVTVTAATEGADGHIRGSGYIDDGAGQHLFALDAWQYRSRDFGRLDYSVRLRGARRVTGVFVATSVSSVTFAAAALSGAPAGPGGRGQTATIVGQGRWNGKPGYSYRAVASDLALRGMRDRFALVVTDTTGSVVAQVDGSLSWGSIQFLPFGSR